jgi:hypothetical protein
VKSGPAHRAKFSVPTSSQAAVTRPMPGRAGQAGQRLRPRASFEHRGDLGLQRGDPPVEVGDQLVEVLAHARDDHRPLQQRVALVARLRAHRQQPVARDQPLPHLVVDRRRRASRGRAQRGGELREVPRVERVGLRPAQLGLGEVVRLARVDDGDPVARLVQGDASATQ